MKRGIIPLLNIGIRFNKKDFEYDVYSLVKAFYPQGQVQMYYEDEEHTQEYEILLLVTYSNQEICLEIKKEDTRVFYQQVSVDYEKDRKETKNVLKRLVYEALCEITGHTLPWGNLTGIRPTKIPTKLLEEGWKNVDIAKYLRDTYGVSREKTALAVAIANREKAVLEQLDYEKGYSLYVGIPFCPSICLYCSFGSHPLERWKKRVDEYLDALCRELSFIADAMKGRSLNTVYIGGGTPTTLEPEQLRRLLGHIRDTFDLSQVKEYTVEAGRPDSITLEKLQVIREFPVTRISVNPQTMNQKTLDIIGRKHKVEDTVEIFQLARELGFDNINMDLIIGLPGEGKEEVEHTLREIRKLHPDSLTIHSLALKRATRLNLFKDQYTEMSFENSQEIMEMTQECARDMGLNPYYLYRQKNIAGNFENVGYAEVDKEGIYNILIMEEKQTILAAGAGASTKFVFQHGERIERVENVKDVKQYIERLDEMLERKRAGIAAYLE
ncbi:MAG: coproporphyrinogen dehydrogenase HemZ [Oliverpabstia sp.]|nr:coproporphyrinogen dehydrogenase HemZ [Oliverpabstia sp.]